MAQPRGNAGAGHGHDESPDSPLHRLSEEIQARLDQAQAQAERGDAELIALDGQRLQTQHLAQLLQAIERSGPKSVLTALSLEDNLLTDESCAVLRTTLQDTSVCPGLLNINLTGNVGITPLGHDQLRQGLPERPDLKIMLADAQLGSSDDVGLETFKAGAILTEEEQAHAAPAEQWGALGRALAGGAAISHTAQIMREICDAVAHELSKEEAIDEAEAQAQGGVLVTRKVKLPPGQYCRFAVAGAQLALLNDVLALEPPAVIQPGARKPVPAVGSHRYHAGSLVCLLVRCACDPGHASPDTGAVLAAVVDSALLARVARLAFASPNCSCLHTALLDALSVHTLPYMPEVLWAPLLQEMGGPTGKPANSLPGLLLHHAKVALASKHIGLRSGLVGLIIQLGRDLQLAVDDNAPLKAALEADASWQALTREEGPLAKLLSEQQGSFAGGKPGTMSMHGLHDDDAVGSQVHLRALFGIREYSQMHQSLNLGIPLRQ